MKQKITVCGSNWRYRTEVDPDICGNIHIEACTIALEKIFGEKKVCQDDMDIFEDEEPNVGVLMSSCETGKEEDEDAQYWLSTLSVAQNAGLLWLADEIQKGEEVEEEEEF